MYGLLYVVLIMCAISVHEMGHAWLMARYGVVMEEICLLGFGPKLCSFKLRRIFGDTPITMRLLPLGAFVKPKSNEMYQPGFEIEDRHIFSGGIAMNLLFAAVLLVPSLVMYGFRQPIYVIFEIVLLGCWVAIWYSPRASGVLVVLLGSATLAMLAWALSKSPVTEVMGGPVAMFAEAGRVDSIAKALFDGALISLSLAMLNAVPSLPLDGGQVCLSYIRHRFGLEKKSAEYTFIGVSVACFGSILALAFSSDIIKYLL